MSAQIIEMLQGIFIPLFHGNTAVQGLRNSFTVNTAANEVAIDTTTALNAWDYTFVNGQGNQFFQIADQPKIISIGMGLPYYFDSGDQNLMLRFGYVTIGGSSGVLSQIAPTTGDFVFPLMNEEIEIDAFIPWPEPISAVTHRNIALQGIMTSGKISMIGVPASLNLAVLYPMPFIKVLHTLPMVNTSS
jgi:hypothetical protein